VRRALRHLAGLKCAALICGTPALRARFNALSPSLLGSPGILALAACRAAWNDSEPWLDRTLARLERNRHQLFSGLRSQLPLLAGQPPQGTYLAWLDTTQLGLNEDAEAFFRRRARVDVAGGAAFGADYRHFIRIAFATPGLILQHALSAMATACLPPGPGAR
jgi:cystathionine beta-lyase